MGKIIPLKKNENDDFHKSVERLAAILDALPVCISYVDKEQRYRFNNRTYEEWFGISREDLREKHIEDVLGPKTYESIRNHIERALSGQSAHYPMELPKKDGTARCVEVELIPDFDDAGGVAGCYAYVSDITVRQQAEEALRLSDERLRAFMNNSPAFMYMKDDAGKHLFANRSLLRYFDVTLDEFIDTSASDYLPADVARRIEEYDREVMEGGTTIETDDMRISMSGRSLQFKEVKFPLPLHSGAVGVGGVVMDITLLKQKEESLRKAYDEIRVLKERLEAENISLRHQISAQETHGDIIGESDAVKYVLYNVRQVGPSDATVLILGETGTGKELVAEAIHGESARRKRPLVKVNCAALPANLMESELFGREKGAFTGSQMRQMGRFELADKGTIFLDEVGELPLELQAKLLRVVQSGEFERLGSPHTISVDVRVIASTNRDLAKQVEKGLFREDLYYRLNVFPLTVPPLRDRAEDIPLLVEFFLKKFGKKLGRRIERVPSETMKALQAYAWPGNVRELENMIERSMITSPGSTLRLADRLGKSQAQAPETEQRETLSEVERGHILRVLERTRWKIEGEGGAAEALGLNPSTLRTRMRKLNIPKPPERL